MPIAPAPVRPARSKLLHWLRYLLVLSILAACVSLTVQLFDWHAVGVALSRMRLDVLIMGESPLLALIFALRGWRWLIVLGIRPTGRRFGYSFCANGVSAGLAALTPFQLGEAIKIRMIPDRHGSAWRLGVSAFFTERVLDLCGMVGMGLYGLLSHLGWPRSATLTPLLPLLAGIVLAQLSSHANWLPQRLQPYTEALRDARRVIRAGLLTTAIWLLYAATWWVVMRAMNLALGFDQVSLLLGGVMLAVVASMTPGGLGVSELSSRGIMLWLGSSGATADATAIAIRVLTPIIAIAGLACLLPLWRHSRHIARQVSAADGT
jgi:Predicted integral membrane protein